MINATHNTGAEKMTNAKTVKTLSPKEKAALIADEKRIMDAAEKCRIKWAGIVPMDDNRSPARFVEMDDNGMAIYWFWYKQGVIVEVKS